MSEKALLQELDFAVHLSLPAVLIPLKSRKCANLARFLNEHLYFGPTQVIPLRLLNTCVALGKVTKSLIVNNYYYLNHVGGDGVKWGT